MESFELIHQYTPNDKIVKMKVKNLLDLIVVRWKGNRPADLTRCEEMKSFYMKPTTIINMPFHLHYNNKYDEYECLDGFHRYNALNMIEHKELVNDKVIICYIYNNKTYGELIDIFLDINKSIPVPDLYKGDEYDQSDKKIIECVLNDWKKKYESHFSASNKPCIPQINRETFTELLTDLFKTYKIRSEKNLMELLVETNEWIKNYTLGDKKLSNIEKKTKNFTANQLDKCARTGCYLFLYKDSVLKEIIIPMVKSKHV